jgi:exonuclease III
MKADIVCLQETHASSHSTILSWFRHSGFRVASSSFSNKRCGVAILIKDIYTFTQVRKDDDGRFLQVEIDIEGNKLRFVFVRAKQEPGAEYLFCEPTRFY